MKKYFLLLLGLSFSFQTAATDLTLLVGYQFNNDFEVSDTVVENPSVSGEPGDDLELDGGAAVSLAVDFVFNNRPDQRIGFYLSHHQAQFDDNAGLQNEDMDVTHLHFTAMNYYPKGDWEPFVLAGIGVAYFDPADKTLTDDTRLSAQIGAGANYKISPNLLLRMETRWIPTFFNGSSSGICSGGCTIALQSDTYSQFQANIGLQYRF